MTHGDAPAPSPAEPGPRPDALATAPRVVGVRGATTVHEDSAEAILSATEELLRALVERNGLHPRDLASALFTVTPDLRAAFPTRAAHALGWSQVPMLCAQEIPVPGALGRVIRVLLHWNTARPQARVHHVYLRGAVGLRPDWAAGLPPAPGPDEEPPP